MTSAALAKSYDSIAGRWHADMVDSTYGLSLIDKAISYCTEKRTALDVGCGSGGRILRRLLENGFAITGLDISEGMLQLARQLHPEVIFEQADIIGWETENTYDLIIAWDSIFHLPQASQKPVLAKLCRFLKPQGILIYTFGDAIGEHVDRWHNESFGYSSIGINENLKVLMEGNCECRHLELDQFPHKHVVAIARKRG